jgi:phage FluMu gp28-like protein
MALPSLNFFQPYQRAWINDDARTAIVEKSRRIGFTFAEAYRSVERRIKLGTDHYFASRDRDSAEEFLQDCKMFVQAAQYVAEDLGEQVIDNDRGLTAFVLRFKPATEGRKPPRIVALSSNPDVFRGKGGDVTLDEFAFHREPAKVLKAANASAKVLGHQLRIISTHNGQGSLFNKLITECREGKRKWSLHRVTLMDAIEQGFVERVKKLPAPDQAARDAFFEEIHGDVLNEDELNEEYLCQPSSDQSSLLSYDLIGRCEDDRQPLFDSITDLPREGDNSFSFGMDVGRKKDLSVLWGLKKMGDVYHTALLKEYAKMDYTSQEQQVDLLMGNPRVRRLCIDSTGIGAMLAERMHRKYGHRVEPVNFTMQVKADLAMPLLRLFQDKLLRVPAKPEVREDLHKVRRVVTMAGNIRFEAERDDAGHSDRFWALALAAHAAQSTRVPLPPPLARKPVGW